MSFISEYFMYDGIDSRQKGVIAIHKDSGLLQMPFAFKRNVIEEKIKRVNNPYFYGFENESFIFNITIMTMDDIEWTDEKRMEIVNWLYQDEYKPFISGDNTGIIYYCTPINDAKRFDNCLKQGYVTITFKCNSPFGYTPIYNTHYDYRNSKTNIIEIENLGNVERYYYPEIQVKILDGKDFKIINQSDGGNSFEFKNLNVGETIYINNNLKQIVTNNPNTYRLSNFNKKWFRLVKGKNVIRIDGAIIADFRMSFPVTL